MSKIGYCHFTPMNVEVSDIEYGEVEYYECIHCGHTEEIERRWRS